MTEIERQVRLNPPHPLPPCQITLLLLLFSEVACQACARALSFLAGSERSNSESRLLHLVKTSESGRKLGFIRKSAGDSDTGMRGL